MGVIILGALFLLTKLLQNVMSGGGGGAGGAAHPVLNFNLEASKKALTEIGIPQESEFNGKKPRNILEKPSELSEDMRRTLYGELVQGAAPEAEVEKPLLEGIVYSGEGGNNIAIISGNVVSEGDSIGKSKVFKIEQDKVILLRNGEKIELKR